MSFRPSIPLTLALLALIFLFARLGLWQLERKAEKRLLFEQFDNAPMLPIEQALPRAEHFVRVEAYGHYDPHRHILLDNRILNGRPGVHALTPFTLTDGTTLLVNRGWLPLPADRRSLPEVTTDDSMLVLTGILKKPSRSGPRVGGPDRLDSAPWPQLMTYYDPDLISAALGIPLAPWLLLLDPGDESGFQGRQWTPAVMGPEVHGAYALQWFSLAVATLIIWITLGLRRAQQRNSINGKPPGDPERTGRRE